MVVRDQKIQVTFRSDDETANVVKDAMETAALAMMKGATDEHHEALFRLACERLLIGSNRDVAA